MTVRLYEPAAKDGPALAPLWQVGSGWSVFAGALDFNDTHTHSVPVFIAGLYETFRIRIGGDAWTGCRAAVVPAGMPYALKVGGKPVVVLYLEPTLAGASALAPLLQNTREVEGALVGSSGEISLLRELYENGDSVAWSAGALEDLTRFGLRRERRGIDARVRRAVEHLHLDDTAEETVADAARRVGLSTSRFQHLFSDEVGVPFRRYRSWQRLRKAIREVIAGSNFTVAAHAAGFFDQSHFAHEFRRTFGAPASRSLSGIRE